MVSHVSDVCRWAGDTWTSAHGFLLQGPRCSRRPVQSSLPEASGLPRCERTPGAQVDVVRSGELASQARRSQSPDRLQSICPDYPALLSRKGLGAMAVATVAAAGGRPRRTLRWDSTVR